MKQADSEVFNALMSTLDNIFDELHNRIRFSTNMNAFGELLGLFALKFIWDIGDAWDRDSQGSTKLLSWDDVASMAVKMPIDAGLVLEVAHEVEIKHECLNGVFTRGLLNTLSHFPAEVLSQIILQLTNISTVSLVAEARWAFGHWFNKKTTSLTEANDFGEFATLASVADLMVRLADINVTDTIFDPCCGVGTILARASENVSKISKHHLYGQEIRQFTWSLCKLRLFLLEQNVGNILHGNALQEPLFTSNGEILHFDRVLCDPPFGTHFGDQHFVHDFSRFPFGKSGSREGAFVQLAFSSLKPKGTAVILVSHGFLFRSGADARIREGLAKRGDVRAVIGLPKRVRAETMIETALVVLQKDLHTHGVFFIDASNLQAPRRGRTEITNDMIQTILQLLANEFKNQPDTSRFVPLKEIQSSDYSLLPRRYVSGPSKSLGNLSAIQDELSAAEREYQQIIQEMDTLLHKIPLND
jgi:type I restriction enzyme M protein